MKVENVPAFIERFEEFVSQNILPEQTCAVIDINAEIDFRDITPKFFSDLKKFNHSDRTMPNPFSVRTMSMIMVPAKS